MKTKLFIAAFALALTCTVTSCGNKKAETAAPAADSVKVDSVKTAATDSVKTDSVKSTSVDKTAKPAEKK
ncbi:hypothetical protein [uncultured Bacteroides sp.]|uniref:hypothetical protein n=1 Tax=uncultured Bacteroides sp. TaxID=162156 RepID=UPI002AA66077|nr:hypothetical protein [uncultured Bacteroides sp.]